jgi:EAL domain-containing protein (putative c-di-GMP-specific phosphodiesterase class I)
LSELGLRISMDDFGTGYGSFCHLKELPFDEMKIDMQFVTGIGHDRRSEIIIEGFLTIAHGLNAVVVAEGIETQDQTAFLRERDCDFGQGFLFGRPMTVDQAELYLQKHAQQGLPPTASDRG